MEPTNDDTTIRKVLAEFMGWQYDIERQTTKGETVFVVVSPDGISLGYSQVPDYTHDLNACHEVEAELERRGLLRKWFDWLCVELNVLDKISHPWIYGVDILLRVTQATAEQRARAAYAVIKAQQEERRQALREITRLGQEIENAQGGANGE